MSDPELSDTEVFRIAREITAGTASDEDVERAKAEAERARADE
jgi:hypothetical protein